MPYFAQLDDALTVTQVIVINDETLGKISFPESETVGVAFCQSLFGLHTNWKQTSYDASFRKNFAGIGYSYNPALDAFIAPSPYSSWILDLATCQWFAPVPYPSDGKSYAWDETVSSWILVETPAWLS